ncbi:hypothetical protein Bbelb_225350 [Branchiostoma belcheri]|nr:hypothetical protein Bbelb_225350 [Branchiostoma belcheri]
MPVERSRCRCSPEDEYERGPADRAIPTHNIAAFLYSNSTTSTTHPDFSTLLYWDQPGLPVTPVRVRPPPTAVPTFPQETRKRPDPLSRNRCTAGDEGKFSRFYRRH